MSSGIDQTAPARERPDLVSRGAYRVGRGLGRLRRGADRLAAAPPWTVLTCLVVADWLVVVEAARIALHRGWLYYDGGDGTWYYTSAWLVAHGHVPQATIGYGYSFLIAPVALIAGANILAGLPLIIFLNAAVLAPIALVSLYGLAQAIGGRLFAYGVAVVWVALPLAAISYFYADYHFRYVDVTLPAVVGLIALGDYPSMVCLLVAAYFAYRALSAPSRARLDGLAAGLAAGIAIGVKPANALFLPAAVCALAVARRPRQLAAFAVGLAPSVLALALWKYRGLGHVPLLSVPSATVAGGVHPGGPVGSVPIHLGRYLHFNYTSFKGNLDGFREWGWSKRLIEWVTLAGLIGLVRRSIAGAALIGGWFAAYLLLKGGDPIFSMAAGNFLTHMIAALPAWVLLVCSVVFCIPIYGRRPHAGAAASWPASRRARRGVVAGLGALAVLPILVIAALSPLTGPAAADIPAADLYVPANQFPLTATAERRTVVLRWPAQATHGTRVTYFVYRSAGDGLSCAPQAHATSYCVFQGDAIALLPGHAISYRDRPPPGSWTYRVALAARAMGAPDTTTPLLLSSAAAVRVGP